jgi:hypothetical protein
VQHTSVAKESMSSKLNYSAHTNKLSRSKRKNTSELKLSEFNGRAVKVESYFACNDLESISIELV